MEDNKAVEAIKTVEIVKEKELKGLGGWLILVAIGLIVFPINLLHLLIFKHLPIFQNGVWEALTTKNSENYHSLWAPLLIGEISFNCIMLILSFYLIYLFFTKHYLFPKFYVSIRVISIIVLLLDAWLVTFVVPSHPIFSSTTTSALLGTMIWVPYMLVSKKVKATFIEKKT